jgi:pimeloyl-ACP methyl ester carboxylesterase
LRNHGDSPHDPKHDYTTLAIDVEDFMDEHKLSNTTIIGHSMGAKTAMCVALRSPQRVANLIPVDNAPIDAALKSDFNTYVKGMVDVQRAKVKKQSEADEILKPYAKVFKPHWAPSMCSTLPLIKTVVLIVGPYSGTSCTAILAHEPGTIRG